MPSNTLYPVPASLFTRYRLPHSLRANGAGALCFATRQASLAQNSYLNRLWLLRGGKLRCLLDEDFEFSGHWWAGNDRLLLATPGGPRQKAHAQAGLPFTLLQLLPVGQDAADMAQDAVQDAVQDALQNGGGPSGGPAGIGPQGVGPSGSPPGGSLLANAPCAPALPQAQAHNAPGSAKKPRLTTLAELYAEVEQAQPLPGGDWLLLARWNADAQNALDAADGDAEKAAEALRENGGCRVLDQLPYWENGEGYLSGWRRRLFIIQNGQVRPLTDAQSEVSAFRLLPGGEKLCYIAKSYTTHMPVADALWLLDISTGQRRRLCIEENFRHDAVVPLDGATLLVAGSNMARHGLHQNPAFYRVDVATGQARQLYDGGEYSAECTVNTDVAQHDEPLWPAQNGRVWWPCTLGQSAHLMYIDAETGDITQVSWQAGAVLELARLESATVVTALRGQNGPELYQIDDDGHETQLTQFNTEAAREYYLATPRPLSFKNAAGREISGLVLPPQNSGAAQSCPAILYIHGGPKMVHGPALQHEMQYLAGLGYTVLLCNPTGSDGAGDDFADLRGAWGRDDYDDVMAFCDAALAACPFIDPARLGVAGGSYGGFLVNSIIGRSGRFGAAVSQRGIANFQTMAALSDIGYFLVPDQCGTEGITSPQDADTLWRQSPLKDAEKATTPTLFIHSGCDYRCHPAESLQMLTALLSAGVPAKLCLFEEENHNLNRSGTPAARLRRLEEIGGWFTRYLPPGL